MLVLVRHGETDANAAGLLLGRADVALSERGRAQAEALAEAVHRTHSPTRVVCSPLLRARQTASSFGIGVEVDERWVEVDYGVFDRTPLAEVPGELWSQWRSDPGFVPEGGESLAACGRRVREACDELAHEAGGSDVVVVSHVSPVKVAAAWALGAGDELTWRMFLGLASITRVAVGDRGPVLRTFNEVAHIAV